MANALSVELGLNIRAQREKLELTQTELADAVGMSRTSITNVERGRQRLLVEQLYEISLALETPISDLIPPVGLTSSSSIPTSAQPEQVLESMPTVTRWLQSTKSGE